MYSPESMLYVCEYVGDLCVCNNMYVIYMSVLYVCVVCMTVYLPIFFCFYIQSPFLGWDKRNRVLEKQSQRVVLFIVSPSLLSTA